MIEISLKTLGRMIKLLEDIVDNTNMIDALCFGEEYLINLSNEADRWYTEAEEILLSIKGKNV